MRPLRSSKVIEFIWSYWGHLKSKLSPKSKTFMDQNHHFSTDKADTFPSTFSLKIYPSYSCKVENGIFWKPLSECEQGENIFSSDPKLFFASSVFTQKRKLVIMEFWVRIWKKSRKWQIFVAIGTNYSTLLRTEKSFKFLVFFWSPRPLKVCGKSSNAADFIGKSFFRVQLNAVYVWEVCTISAHCAKIKFLSKNWLGLYDVIEVISGQLRPFLRSIHPNPSSWARFT